MRQVKAAAPVAPWLGGKKRLRGRIIQRIEAIDHRTYIDSFVGMGGVFLRQRFRLTLEVASGLKSKTPYSPAEKKEAAKYPLPFECT